MSTSKFQVGVQVEHTMTGDLGVVCDWDPEVENHYVNQHPGMCDTCGTTPDGHLIVQYPGFRPQIASATYLRIVEEDGDRDS